MKLLLDENLPRKLKNFFGEQEVYTVKEMGWSEKTNGELLALLHPNGFDVLITSEKSLRFQQALQKYHAAVIILLANDNRLRTLKQLVPKVINALDFVKPGRNYSARQSVLSTECTTCNVNRLHNPKFVIRVSSNDRH